MLDVNAGASSAKLQMCKGTVREKPLKQHGHIDLDIGDKTCSVKVFFVPARADLVGSRFKEARVQFHLGFTSFDGYEAYDVSHHYIRNLNLICCCPTAWYCGCRNQMLFW